MKISCRNIAVPLMLKFTYPDGYHQQCEGELMKIYASLSCKEPGPKDYDYMKSGKPKNFAISSPLAKLEE
jgi:hypothetical protein